MISVTLGVATAAQAENRLHVTFSDPNGGLWHGVRPAFSAATAYGNVKSQAGDPGWVTLVSTQMINNVLHVLVSTSTNLFHTSRTDSGWTPFVQLNGPNEAYGYRSIGTANVDGKLHVVGLTWTGIIRHAVRDGASWTPLNVLQQETVVGSYVAIDCAGIRGDLHVVLADTSSGGKLWHRVRYANGSWSLWGDVHSRTGWLSSPSWHSQLSVSAVAGELHVLQISGGTYYHTIRRPDDWYVFGNVETQVPDAGNPSHLATTSYEGELVVSEAYYGATPVPDQRLVRRSSAAWTVFGTPLAATGAGAVNQLDIAGETDSATWTVGGLSSPHYRSIDSLSQADRAHLANLLLEYITPETNAEHSNSHWHSHEGNWTEAFFTGHRGYIAKLHTWLINRGEGRFVPLPYWDPWSQFIPAEFRVVDQGYPSLQSNPVTPALPSNVHFPSICQMSITQLVQAVESPWHNTVHNNIGGVMANRNLSPLAPLFFAWHSFVDSVYARWFACNRG